MSRTIELAESIADLHLGTIDMPEWLQRMADLTQSDAAYAVS